MNKKTIDESSSLAIISNASKMLLEANTIQKAKDLKDLALTAADWARRKGLGDEAIQYAKSYALRAERKMGEMLVTTERARGGQPYQKSTDTTLVPVEIATLKELGVTKKESSEAQFLAAMADEEFNEIVAGKKTVIEARKAARVIEREKHINGQRSKFPGKAVIYQQDAIEFLNSIDNQSIDLLLTDPPYSTAIDDIEGFAASWVPLALSKIKPSGRAYICTGAYPRELKAYLDVTLQEKVFDLKSILVWTYKNAMGPAPKLGYHLNWQAVFYLVGPDAPDLDAPKLTEREAVHELHVPRPSKDTWQKPDELADRFVRHSTRIGGSVIDPFAGTGTFVRVAAEIGRNAVGSDNDPQKIAICKRDGLECR